MVNQSWETEARLFPSDPQERAGKDVGPVDLETENQAQQDWGGGLPDWLWQRGRWATVSRLAGVHRPQPRPGHRGTD